jgi:hypothetical protein
MSSNVVGNRIDPAARDVLDGLENHVQCCMGREINELHIECRDGGLVLHGYASNYHARQQTEDLVTECSELPIQANEIEVT